MSVQPPADDLEGYCSPSDVARFFNKEETFGFTDDPDREEIIRSIRAQSNYIDRETGHAFRPRKVVNEFHDFDGPYRFRSGMPIKLGKRDIRTPLDPEKGDKLELFRGGFQEDDDPYTNWLERDDRKEGRNEDFWIEEPTGMLHIFARAFFSSYRELRITYRYGKERVPQEIQRACAKLVAADLLLSQQYRINTPGNEGTPDPATVSERYREQAERLIDNYKEYKSVGL